MILIGTLAGTPAVAEEAVANTFGESSSTGAGAWGAVVLAGVACDLASIPFFISASKNKRLAGEVQINNQKMYLLQRSFVGVKYVPGITVKINIGK